MDLLKTKEKVEYYLKKYPEYRDSDERLTASIWLAESSNLGCNSAYDFLKAYSEKKVSNAESIRRSRQKLQQIKPELRGEKFKERHKHIETIVYQLNKIENEAGN